MGTLIQSYELVEADFRGERFADHPRDLRGDTDLLSLVRPGHRAGDPRRVPRRRRRHHRDQHLHRDPHRPGRLRPDRGRPRDEPRGARGSPAQAADARRGRRAGPAALRAGRARPDQPDRLDLAGRRRTRAPATSPSTSSRRPTRRRPRGWSRAARTCWSSRRSSTRSTPRPRSSASRPPSTRSADRVPLIISGTITDASGRTLSGQTVEAFWTSVRARPAARGRAQLRARRAAAPRPHRGPVADRGHPRQRLPERRAAQRVRRLRRAARRPPPSCSASTPATGSLNIAGGCCGTTPAHVRAIAEAVAGVAPRAIPVIERKTRLSGLQAADHPAAGRRLRQRRRADQRHRLAQVRQAHPRGPLRRGRRGRPPAGRGRRPAHRREHGRGDARLGRGDDALPQPHRLGAGHQRRPGDARLLEVGGHRGRAQVHPGHAASSTRSRSRRARGRSSSTPGCAAATAPRSWSWPSTSRARRTPPSARSPSPTRAYRAADRDGRASSPRT